jgi:hypothetical protein
LLPIHVLRCSVQIKEGSWFNDASGERRTRVTQYHDVIGGVTGRSGLLPAAAVACYCAEGFNRYLQRCPSVHYCAVACISNDVATQQGVHAQASCKPCWEDGHSWSAAMAMHMSCMMIAQHVLLLSSLPKHCVMYMPQHSCSAASTLWQSFQVHRGCSFRLAAHIC